MRSREYDPDKTMTSAITGGVIGYLVYPAIAVLLFWFGAGTTTEATTRNVVIPWPHSTT